MATIEINGRRVYADESGRLTLQEGDYGKTETGEWLVRPPGNHTGSLKEHNVVEHEDGTITVTPSILIDDGRTKWHGYLIRGIFREC